MPRETYILQLGDAEQTFDSDGTAVFGDGQPVNLAVTDLGNGRFSVLYNGRSRVISVEAESGASINVRDSGGLREVSWKDRRAALLERMGFAAADDGPEREIRAPMPGLVLKVLVEEGQKIEAGDGLVVLEAMKMENELRAATAGTVARVLAKTGEAVVKDALLVEVEA